MPIQVHNAKVNGICCVYFGKNQQKIHIWSPGRRCERERNSSSQVKLGETVIIRIVVV